MLQNQKQISGSNLEKISGNSSKKISAIFIALSIFASVKMLFFAYGLDEEYQLVMSYRNAVGERLFFSMWEPHQSSAFLCTLLMKPYLQLFGTTGLVLYLRLMGTLIHLAISCYFYRVLKHILKPDYAWLLALTYYNTIPKQIMMPEFGIMQVWFFTLMMLFLLQYYRKGKPCGYLLAAALCLVLEVLSYPSCLILYPFVLVLLFQQSGAQKWRDMGIFTGVCGCCGISYLSMLLRGRTLPELLDTLSLILAGDVTHGSTVSVKLLSAVGNVLYLLLLLGLIAGLSMITQRFLIRKKKKAELPLLFIFFACLVQMLYWTVWNKGYEKMQIHLVAVTLVTLVSVRRWKKTEDLQQCSGKSDAKQQCSGKSGAMQESAAIQGIFKYGIVGSVLSLMAVVYLTDLTLMDSLPHAMMAAFFAMALFLYQWEKSGEDKTKKSWVYWALVLWCLTAVFGKGYTLRSGTGYHNVLESGGILRYGPAIGTISNYMGAYVYNCDYEDWQAYIQDGDKVMIVVDQVMNLGTTQYLFQDVEISHFSIVNPTAYDERLIDYWKRFPEKKPNVIIVDCWYGELMTNPDSYIMHYIEEEFPYQQVQDGRYIRIYRS